MNRYRALVVEDEMVACEAASIALEEEGFLCTCVSDGAKALGALEQGTFDAIVTDLRMPRLHGHSLAQHVISQGINRPMLFILTGVSEPRLIKDLIARGVDDVTIKPVDLATFAAKVKGMCDRRYWPVQDLYGQSIPQASAPPSTQGSSPHACPTPGPSPSSSNVGDISPTDGKGENASRQGPGSVKTPEPRAKEPRDQPRDGRESEGDSMLNVEQAVFERERPIDKRRSAPRIVIQMPAPEGPVPRWRRLWNKWFVALASCLAAYCSV